MRYQLTLPREPSPKVINGRSWTFELTPAIWFGMALCDTQSYPEQVSTCPPDSDSNITSNANLAHHVGTAFMELQFYPPGFIKQFNGSSCDARDWCAAMTIDSLSEDPVNGTNLNTTCQNEILGGEEYVNFAFLTKNGKPIGRRTRWTSTRLRRVTRRARRACCSCARATISASRCTTRRTGCGRR
jgi:hypothetical protein